MCQKLEINILETWGDYFYAGLTGIEILDKDFNPIPLSMENIDAKPKGVGGEDY